MTTPKRPRVDPGNPILNSPYEEPGWHYATDQAGNLNYDDVREGRRVFTPDTPVIPLAQQQPGMFDINDLVADYQDLVNLLRREVGAWREEKYPGVTSRVTRDLFDFWFLNPDREDHDKLFFAQQEAVETAVWLNEIAERSNAGTHVLERLAQAQRTVSDDPAQVLPRVAFKMATGSGKTVVMACLILYHFLNRRQYRNDTRYADDFLVVAPGITIRDRLQVLLVDTSTHKRFDAQDYYRQRALVPPQYEDDLDALNARLIITNYHAFEPRVLTGNKKSPFDGKLDASGKKREAKEDFNLVIKRVLGKLKPGRRLLILNDEAHHCYLPKAKGEKKWTVENRWLPAVNGAGTSGWWDLVEVSEDIRTVKNQLAEKLSTLTAKTGDDWNIPGAAEDEKVAGTFLRAQESSMRDFWKETRNDDL